MRAVDTNVLVRLLARDHPVQLAAAEAFVQAGAWVSLLVLMETVWVLDSVYGIQPGPLADGGRCCSTTTRWWFKTPTS